VKKAFRMVVAALAMVMLVGLAPQPSLTGDVQEKWQFADPNLPEGS